ncbi:MAG: hypothetical protein ABR585_08210 [Gemmatimonadaceae bacterium]
MTTLEKIQEQWRRLTLYSPWRFVLAVWLLNMISVVPILVLAWVADRRFHFFSEGLVWPDLKKMYGVWMYYGLVVIWMPWLETVIGQWLPWDVTRALKLPPAFFVVLATVWFAFLHGLGFHGPNFWLMVLSHVIASLLLALTFLQGRKHSLWRGIWMTAMVHMLINFTVSAGDAVNSAI